MTRSDRYWEGKVLCLAMAKTLVVTTPKGVQVNADFGSSCPLESVDGVLPKHSILVTLPSFVEPIRGYRPDRQRTRCYIPRARPPGVTREQSEASESRCVDDGQRPGVYSNE